MDAKVELQSFLAERVTPFLGLRGFHRRGQRYTASRGENTLFVQFQRRATFFTCDIGVVSALLLREIGPTPPEHWRSRLGSMTVGYDKWWDLAAGPEAVASDFLAALARGIERVGPLARDEGLRDELMFDVMYQPGIGSSVSSELALPLMRVLGAPAWASDAVLPTKASKSRGSRRTRERIERSDPVLAGVAARLATVTGLIQAGEWPATEDPGSHPDEDVGGAATSGVRKKPPGDLGSGSAELLEPAE